MELCMHEGKLRLISSYGVVMVCLGDIMYVCENLPEIMHGLFSFLFFLFFEKHAWTYFFHML